MDVKIGELEDLFERYRSQQDLRALSKLFDLAAPELLRLAVHMAPDVASAEDLVQQTFLAAIEKPKRWRAGEPLLPWLFGILANLSKKQRRALRRRPETDRLTPRSAEDPARHTLDAETQSAILSALDSLPELYREVVRASLFDEKPPHQIARELERAPGTVRMQLLRGLELLRRALPGGLAGGALVLCGTRGEAALKAVVLEKAAAAPVLIATSTLTLGGLLVSTKAALAVIVCALGLCTWLVWPRAPREGDVVGASQDQFGYGSLIKADGHGGTYTEPLPVHAPGESRSAVEPSSVTAPIAAKPAGGVFLVGRLLGVAPEHAAEVDLEVSLPSGLIKGKAKPDGTYELDLAEAGPAPREKKGLLGITIKITPPKPVPGETSQVSIWARHPRYISEHEGLVATDLFAELAPGERREVRCDLHLRPAAIVSGRVRVPTGWKVEEADVRLDMSAPGHADGLGLSDEHSSCDQQGTFRIKSIRRGEVLVRAELPGLLPVVATARIEPGSELVLPDLVLEESTCAIRGRVDLPARLLQSDDPMELRLFPPAFRRGVQVWARRVDLIDSSSATGAQSPRVFDLHTAQPEREVRGGCAVTQQSSLIEGDRSFALRGLEPGKWELSVEGIQDNGTLPLLERMIIDAPAEGIVLGEQLGSIAIVVLDSNGPVKGASVTVGDGMTFSTFNAGDDGHILLLGDLRKNYTASAGAPGREKAALELPASVRAREANYELRLSAPPELAMLVFRPGSGTNPPKSVQVKLRPAQRESELQERTETLTLANGRYELGNVLPGHWKITLGPAEIAFPVAFFGDYLMSERFDLTLAPGEKCERALRCERGGRLRIDIDAPPDVEPMGIVCALDALGSEAIQDPIFVCAVTGEGFGGFSASDHLRVRSERTQVGLQDCLPPGRYELRITSDKVHAHPLVFEIKLGETTQASWKIEK